MNDSMKVFWVPDHCRRYQLWMASLLAVCVLFYSSLAAAQLRIEIRRGVERPVPMAIVPFSWEAPSGTALPVDVSGVITADLAGSGRFDPIAERDMVSRPTLPEQVDFQDWRLLEVDVLVIGRVIQDGPDRYTVIFQLYDILRGEQLVGYRLTTPGADLRLTAHRVSDMIYEQLTGIPGVFSTQVAYISEQRENGRQRFRLIVADADGANAQIVADSPDPLMSPSWSPDGRRLAYVSFEGDQSAIYVQTLRSGVRDRVSARVGINGAPAFSPDGRSLALTLSRDAGNLDIFMLDLTTQVLIRLTNNPAIDTEATWAMDGQSIYFTSDRSGGPQIYRVDARAGAQAQRVTFEGAYNARARVSPDGRQLAVVHQDRGNYRIAVVDPRTGLTQVLSNGSLDESPSFAPNGALIIYATRDKGRGVLSSVSTDGRIQQQIAAVAGDVREPVWSPYARP
jgi:TolB protein